MLNPAKAKSRSSPTASRRSNPSRSILNSSRMEYHFAQSNGFKVGDKITIRMPGDKTVEYEIKALVCAPETSVVSQDSYSLSSARDFAYLYLPRAEIDTYYSAQVFNEILVKFLDGKAKTLDDIEKMYDEAESKPSIIIVISLVIEALIKKARSSAVEKA